MPVPLYALQRIGLQRIRYHEPMTGGWTNRVWRVGTFDGHGYIVKQTLGRWALDNEVAACRVFSQLREPSSKLYAVGATIIVFEDDGARAAKHLDERLIREVGWRLRRLHERTRIASPPEYDHRCLLHRARRRAAIRGDDDVAWCMTHGDVAFDNVVVGGANGALRLIDFEEFHPGDPLVDLATGAVELGCELPKDSGHIVNWLVRGYMDGAPATTTSTRWQRQELRIAFAQAVLEEAIAWARWAWKTDLVDRYERAGKAVLEAIGAVEQ